MLEADQAIYPKLYEAQKAKVQQILASEKADWLQKPAVIANISGIYDANQRLTNIGKFFEAEEEQTTALYRYNPEYFKTDGSQPTKPILIEVQFRYEISPEKGFSERLFNNFQSNYDFGALRKMLE